MTPDELLEFSLKAARAQLELNQQSLDNQLQAAERISARQASEALSEVAKLIALNPTQ
jgi:hypothetical protein